MSKLRLSFACWNYDRTRALMEGRIPVDGIDLTYLNLPVEETFFRMLRHHEFDVAEMSLSSYVMSRFRESPPFIAIPIFPSRFFRHSCIYVNRNSGIAEPKDLIGKRVGTPEFQMTAGVWIRGILSDEYQVPVTGVDYFNGGEEQPGRGPSTFTHGSGAVRRLFEDYPAVERAYYLKTKIFPVMHTVVIRQDVYERYPWVAQSLYKAFVLAQREVYQDLYQTAALKYMLPWLIRHVEDTRALMGQDFWAYGFEPNVHVLETFLRYSFEQGLSKRRLKPHELFAKESLESFKI